MIILKNQKTIDKKIEVAPYLTYAQIQNIVNSVCHFDNWAERTQNIDILLLYYATNLTKEEIENYGHDFLLETGVIDDVKNNVKNFNQIYEALTYTQSIEKSLAAISKQLPNAIKEVINNGRNSNKK